tara:strand:- start:436 stop:963 length:528 start_codon:yes stop_codon:yes gene_type:complete
MDICLGAADGAPVVEAGAGGVSSLVDVDFNVGFARMASINALRKSGSVAALAVGATLARGGVGGAGVDDASPRFRSFDLLWFRIAAMSALRPESPTSAPGGSCAGGALAGAAPGGGGGGAALGLSGGGGGGGGAGIVDPSPGIGSESTTSGSGVADAEGAMDFDFSAPDHDISAA